MFNQLNNAFDKNCAGLNREEGLAVINKANGPKFGRVMKDTVALFTKEILLITIETNLIKTEFEMISSTL